MHFVLLKTLNARLSDTLSINTLKIVQAAMIIRAYLRASTKEQDANRARHQLKTFAADHDVKIGTFYLENESGAKIGRPELQRLIAEAHEGDILLCEAIDRLSRHEHNEWTHLRHLIEGAGLRIVAADMPLTWEALKPIGSDPMLNWMQTAMTNMVLEVMAAFARKDYERRRHVLGQGIAKAKAAGVYKGKAIDRELHDKVESLLGQFSIRKIAKLVGCSPGTVVNVKRIKIAEQANLKEG